MKKIVLIEDNPEIRETTQEILELADYDVVVAENGKKGVELVKEYKPDLIICDIMMPELDGYGVIRILSKNPDTSTIPFIFLSAKADKTDLRKGMNMGADDYLTKPFEEGELLEVIESRIKRSESIRNSMSSSEDTFEGFIRTTNGMAELNNLIEERKVKQYAKKEVIFREDDFANYLYYIRSGKVKCLKSDSYGKDMVSDIYGKGDFIGYMALLEGGEYHETAVAMENTEVSVILKEDFTKLINNNREVATNFIKLLAGNVKDREERMLHLAYSPLRERVAHALLHLKEKDQSTIIRISREDLACLIGTAKESLVRALSDFKRDELIHTDGQEIQIIDEQGLKDYVGD